MEWRTVDIIFAVLGSLAGLSALGVTLFDLIRGRSPLTRRESTEPPEEQGAQLPKMMQEEMDVVTQAALRTKALTELARSDMRVAQEQSRPADLLARLNKEVGEMARLNREERLMREAALKLELAKLEAEIEARRSGQLSTEAVAEMAEYFRALLRGYQQPSSTAEREQT